MQQRKPNELEPARLTVLADKIPLAQAVEVDA
jgi:hypothetical protein